MAGEFLRSFSKSVAATPMDIVSTTMQKVVAIKVDGRTSLEPDETSDFNTTTLVHLDGSISSDEGHKLLEWSSNREDVVSINKKTGAAVAHREGVATITATYHGEDKVVTGTGTVTVKEVPLVKIEFRKENPTLVGGGYVDFALIGTYKNFATGAYWQKALYKTARVTWETSDPKVATVDNAGRATVTGLGHTTIKATAASPAGSSASATTVLTVIPPCPGARKVFVQFHVRDMYKVPVQNAKGFAVFSAYEANAKPVTVNGDIKDGRLAFPNLFLMPGKGDLSFKAVRQEDGAASPQQVATYTLSAEGNMVFNADQAYVEGEDKTVEDVGNEKKVGDKTGDKASTKIGTKTGDKTSTKTGHKTTEKIKGGGEVEDIGVEGEVTNEDQSEDASEHATEIATETGSEHATEHATEDTTKRREEHDVTTKKRWELATFELKQQ